MAKNIEKIEKHETVMPPEEIIISITNKLLPIAKNLISQNQDLSEEKNRTFLENPDDPQEHGPKWHQWGIITHTKMSEKAYREEIPKYLNQWGVLDKIKSGTSEKIDNLSKDQLLRIAILFHDLGKFSERKLKHREDNSVSFSFKNHEITSGKIIRSHDISEMLKQDYSLTDTQIEYVARCAELHFELGFVRDEAKKSRLGYSFAFINSDLFEENINKIFLQYPTFQMEIGLLYFVDFLSKTDIRIQGKTNQEIETQIPTIQKLLEKRGLDTNLIENIKQLPINFLLVEKYLKFWNK